VLTVCPVAERIFLVRRTTPQARVGDNHNIGLHEAEPLRR
jgi:hypothetical protein